MIIGFTGTQRGMSARQQGVLQDLLWQLGEKDEPMATFLHGCCIGADEEASHIADAENWYVVGFPPLNEEKMSTTCVTDAIEPAQDYIARNHSIVDRCDLLIAAPSGHMEWQRSGTWATVRYARKQGKPCIILDR